MKSIASPTSPAEPERLAHRSSVTSPKSGSLEEAYDPMAVCEREGP
jgi:hypothetical protein